MTPKEKAIELVGKFNNHTVKELIYLKNGKVIEGKTEAKQCALIAVDEILEFMEADDFDSDTCYWANHSQMKYWVEVKQEIENL
jgi:hypothetical protein